MPSRFTAFCCTVSCRRCAPQVCGVLNGVRAVCQRPSLSRLHRSSALASTRRYRCRSHCLAAREAGVSLALFAPGWSLECGEASRKPLQQAAESDRKFWLDLGVEQAYRSDL